jgi:hypothetical protein
MHAIADRLEQLAGNQLAGADATADTPHSLVGETVSITGGHNKGKGGKVIDVRPSKFNDGLCATIETPIGARIFANADHCLVMPKQPPAPSVRRPVARKLNGSVPW